MSKLSLFAMCCLAAVGSASTAGAQLLEPVDVTRHGVQSALVYRDIQATQKYYLVPLRLDLARSQNKPVIGVQYFRADGGPPDQRTASLTLSVVVDTPTGELDALRTALIRPGSSATVANLPVRYKLSYFTGATAARSLPARTDVSEGNLAAGATVALTFQVTDTRQNIRALLSGDGTAFGLVMQLEPQMPLGISRSLAVDLDGLADKLKAIGYLAATPDADRTNDALNLLRTRFSTWSATEEAAARRWLAGVLGAPGLSIGPTGRPRLGWDLAARDFGPALATLPTHSLATRSDKPGIWLLLEFGNICKAVPTAIVDLDEGQPGCGGLD